MIQRIQTLYLLLATALMACTLFMPIAHVSTAQGELVLQAFKPFGSEMAFGWLFAALFILATLLPLVTIFLFKYRKRQVGLCAAEGVLQLGAVVVILLFYWLIIPDILQDFTILSKSLGWAFIMPVAALIPTFLAGRAIFRDEVLVRSLDRIR
ncbi:MAG: DUF4293 domain-containing protein [Alistipes sp.]|jgi:hypothetical protein|nr:DUF4293 domain-containing protein [Alistipes sp.]